PLASSDTFDIGVGPGITDAQGFPVAAVTNRRPDANSADTAAPTVAIVKWDVNSASGYQVVVRFSEAMDRLSAQNVSAYRLGGLTVPQTAVVSNDGQSVTLT